MRRVRQDSPGIRAAEGRLAFAIALSAALHIVLIPFLAMRPGGSAILHSSPIQARLVRAESVPVPARRVPVPVPRARAPASVPAAPSHPVSGQEALDNPQPRADDASAATPGFPAIPDLVHYAAKDLDVYPQLRGALNADYPEPAHAQGIAGTVTLLVLIDEAGRVTDISVVDAVPEGLFDDSARQALSRAAFIPAQRDGRRVRSRILVSVNYDPDKP
jgi:protein TonB